MRSSWGDKGQGQSDDSCSLYMLAVIHCSPVHLQHYKHNSAASAMHRRRMGYDYVIVHALCKVLRINIEGK